MVKHFCNYLLGLFVRLEPPFILVRHPLLGLFFVCLVFFHFFFLHESMIPFQKVKQMLLGYQDIFRSVAIKTLI